LAALVLALAGSLSSCSNAPAASSASAADPAPVTLRIGIAVPKTPEAGIGYRSFVQSFYSETLVGVGWDGRPVPRLAASADWLDDRTLKITLREKLKFHDGTPVDSEFVKNALLTTFKGGGSVGYSSVMSVEKDGETAVVVKLSRPEALFLAELSNSYLSLPGQNDVGMGPYKIVQRGATTQLEAFKEYYRGAPQIDKVEIQEYEEQRSSWAALMRGQVDAVHEIVPNAVDFLKDQTNVRTFPFTRPYFTYMIFNVKHPVLKNAAVRQALSYAVDREAIIHQALNKQGTVAEGPIWPFHWAHSTAQKAYTHNPEVATLRLDSAGLSVRPSKTPGGMPSRLRFKCLTIANNATFERIAVLLQKQFYEIGVDMDIETVSLTELGQRASKGDYDAILAERTSGRSLYWTYYVFHSTKFGASYSAADGVLDRLRTASADGEVRATVSDLQQVLHNDPPAIFIAWPTVARVVSAKFQVPESEGGRDVMSSVWQWRQTSTPR
jgi:peptide/nickel transport system substrate-binding protein